MHRKHYYKTLCALIIVAVFFKPLQNNVLAQEYKIDSLTFFKEKIRQLKAEHRADSIYHYALKALSLSDELKIDSLRIRMREVLGNYESNDTRAYKYFQQAEKLAIQNKEWKLLGRVYFGIGSRHFNNNDDKNALVYFRKLDSLSKKEKSDKFLWAMAKVSIVDILFKSYNQNDTIGIPLMNSYLDDGLKISDSFNLSVPAAILLEKKAHFSILKGDRKEAYQYLQKALREADKTDNYIRKSSIYNGIGDLFYKDGKIDSALVYFNKELAIVVKSLDSIEIAVSNYRIGRFYNAIDKPTIGIKHIETAEAILNKLPNVRLQQRFEVKDALAKSYQGMGLFEKAYKASEESKNLLESIQQLRNRENLSELETKYQVEAKTREIELLQAQNSLEAERRVHQRNFFLVITILVAGGVVFFYLLFRNRQKTNKKLQELDKFKTKLFANISHEFRTPLTLISGPVEKQMAKKNISEEDKNDLSLIKQNADRLLHLVDQLLDVTKLESGNQKLNVSLGNLGVFLKQIVSAFQYKAQEKEIDFIIQIPKIENVWFDKDVIEKIVTNLLSNALKYTPKGGRVFIKAEVVDGHLILTILNNGNKLSDKDLSQIFERFYQGELHSEGVGIGLALVKELTSLTHGNIIANTLNNDEIQFTVSIPLELTYFKEPELEINNKIASKVAETTETLPKTEKSDTNGKPILLIVEDEMDIRKFVVSIFEDHYTILETSNGEKGLELAIKHIPDIIISDVMMPILDGVELCKILKTDTRTGHIPVILLTAKSGEENEIIGFETGADDYITKPFSSEKLKIRVENLIELRTQLQQRYRQEFEFESIKDHTTSSEQKFIQQLHQVINENISDSNFKTEELCNKMLMSRMQLHRKLKALTGLSTSKFLNTQRVKMAASLLRETDLSVSEIAYEVGFSNPSYFNRCFKDVYHCTPNSFQE